MIEIIKDEYGVIERKGIPVVGTRKVSETFDRRHDNVLRDVEELISNLLKIEEIKPEENFFTCFKRTYRNIKP